jgi:hypothetical protein
MALNINTVKGTFKADTGLDWSANIHAFIQYYQAKILEQMMDQQQTQMTTLIQKVDEINTNV